MWRRDRALTIVTEQPESEEISNTHASQRVSYISNANFSRDSQYKNYTPTQNSFQSIESIGASRTPTNYRQATHSEVVRRPTFKDALEMNAKAQSPGYVEYHRSSVGNNPPRLARRSQSFDGSKAEAYNDAV